MRETLSSPLPTCGEGVGGWGTVAVAAPLDFLSLAVPPIPTLPHRGEGLASNLGVSQ